MQKTKILIVDDEPHINEMLSVRLEANDFKVITATSGDEALEVLEEHKDTSVILTDLMMPRMSGMEFIERVKEKHPLIEVVVITGYASLETAIEAVKMGAFDYIKKPIMDALDLVIVIQKAARKKKLTEENLRLTSELQQSNDNLKRINVMLGDNINELIMLHHAIRAISGSVNIDQVVKSFLKNIIESLSFQQAILFLLEEKEDVLEYRDCIGCKKRKMLKTRVSLKNKQNCLVKTLKEKKPIYLLGIKEGPDDEMLKMVVEKDTHSLISYPMCYRDNSIGVLIVTSRQEISEHAIHSLELYVSQATLIIENARMFQRLVDMNVQLKKLDEVKSDFISMVSHELRTPLTSIKESVSLLHDECVGDINQKQRRILEISNQNISRLTRLIEDLLDVSRIESGKITLKKKKYKIEDLSKKAIESVLGMSTAKEIKFVTKMTKEMPKVFVDEDRIIQVIVNLLSNAIKFSSRKSEINILANHKKDEQYIEVSVLDSGKGIAPEDQGKLFKKFSQINREMGEGAKGTGLGLVISKSLIEMHGGKLWLKESRENKGTTFSFTLPL